MLKSEIELLIEHLQKEVDYLRSALDACIAEEDFDGAKAFQKPLHYTAEKLRVAKNLQNPLHRKMSNIKFRIANMEKFQSPSRNYLYDSLDEDTKKRMEDFHRNRNAEQIEHAKYKLKKLQSIIPKEGVDDDKIWHLLVELESDDLNKVEFEFKEDKVFLCLTVKDDKAEMKFTTTGKDIEKYIPYGAKPHLRKLGYNLATYSKAFDNYKSVDKNKLLEEIAIITLEVFRVSSDEIMNIRIG